MKLFFLGRYSVLLISVIGLMSLGCSRGPKMPTTLHVSGKVTYQNKPLAGADIAFVSLGDKAALPARGVTDEAGEFLLSTYVDPQHDLRGATAGDYTVTVSKVEKMDQEKMREQFATNPNMEFKKLVPAKYSNPKETPLKATIEASKTNRFEFKLED